MLGMPGCAVACVAVCTPHASLVVAPGSLTGLNPEGQWAGTVQLQGLVADENGLKVHRAKEHVVIQPGTAWADAVGKVQGLGMLLGQQLREAAVQEGWV